MLMAAGLMASTAAAQTVFILDGTSLRSAPLSNPAAISNSLPITGVSAGETLVAIDVRPQTQQLYALGVNAVADTATLYCLSPRTGVAAPVGVVGSIAFVTGGGSPVDLPDPDTVGWDIDFNPAVDRLRVVAGSLNFRVNPNNGSGVDGDNGGAAGSVSGVNPDGPMNGATTTVNAAAYTNSQPNNGGITTQYTLDAATNSLYIQNPPNSGTQTSPLTVTLGGSTLDFNARVGFDIPPGVNAATSNTAVTTGSGVALLTVGGVSGLYTINLVNGQATLAGTVPGGRSMAIRQELGAAMGLSSDGTALVRFNVSTPGTLTTQALNLANLVAGETLVGIDFRPQTGQIYGLGINATSETGTLYLIDPQTGAVSLAVGGAGSGITFAAVDFPDPATVGYGFDFNPTVDRIRVVTGSGLNFRINPNTGLPAAATPDGAINGLPGGSTGVTGTAYTNSFTQSLAGGVTTQYTLDAGSNSLFIQNPPNNGTQTSQIPVTLGGNPLDFTPINGFDIPGAVAVSTSNAPAIGEGWFVATIGGATNLFRLNLSTGEAVLNGTVGAGTTSLSGLMVFASPALKVEDETTTQLHDAFNTLDFGNVPPGSEAARTITLTNTGSQALTYSASIPVGSYTITQNPSGTLAPNASATVKVSLNGAGNGSESQTLTITTNDVANAAFDIGLTGTSFQVLADDAATVTTGSTTVYPLANDGLGSDFEITGVSNGTITISADGRSLLIPSGFTGSFTYTATDGASIGVGTVNVTAGTPVDNPTTYSGLLANFAGDIVGSATVTLSSKGVATVKLAGGSATARTKISVPTLGSSGANFTPLGYVTLQRNNSGTIGVSVVALGGNIVGTLLPAQKTASVAKHHIALGSVNPAFPGGGFAIANLNAKGAVKIVGLLPDGVPFSTTSNLRDNNTIALYASVKGPKPPATIAGELTVADLAATDVSGQISWSKQPQLPGVKGLHLGLVDTAMNAQGSLFDAAAVLPTGSGTLTLAGGDLASDETNSVAVNAAGVPAVPTGALKTWKSVKKAGTFSVTVTVPDIAKPVKGRGLYLPKSNSAWGFFPGKTVGGRIELTVP